MNLNEQIRQIMEMDGKRQRGELTHQDSVATLDNLMLATHVIRELLEVVKKQHSLMQEHADTLDSWQSVNMPLEIGHLMADESRKLLALSAPLVKGEAHV